MLPGGKHGHGGRAAGDGAEAADVAGVPPRPLVIRAIASWACRLWRGAACDRVRGVLTEDVIKRDVVEGEEARQTGGRVKRAVLRRLKKRGRMKKEKAKQLLSTPSYGLPIRGSPA